LVSVPRVIGLCEDRSISPVPLLLMEHVDGLVVDSFEVAEEQPPALLTAIGRALPAELARIHAVDLEKSGLASLSTSRTPYAARQIRRWRGQWDQSRTRDLPAVEDLADRLWAAMPPQQETCLVHGDFHLLNAIVSPRDGRVEAILDWELCTLGDPLADLGGLLAYSPGRDEPAGLLTPFGTLPGYPSPEEVAAVYAEASGRSLDSLRFWQVLGIWKVAVIAEGVMRRAHNDDRNAGAAGAPTTEQIDELVERALTVAGSAGI
jgi:aminoglycoside phosphotransferase (APT) family kinase protein